MKPTQNCKTQEAIADVLATLIQEDCLSLKLPSALLLASDLPLPILRQAQVALLNRGVRQDFLFEDGTKAATGINILEDGKVLVQLLPYCIDEDETSTHETQSQGWAGKLRDHFPYLQPKPDSLRARWLVLLGEPASLDLDTFVTTTARHRFTEPGQPGDRRNLLKRLRDSMPATDKYLEIITQVYLNRKGVRLDDNDTLERLVSFYGGASTFESICQNLPLLGFLPDNYSPLSDFMGQLQSNQDYAVKLAGAMSSSEDLDSWIDDNVYPDCAQALKVIVGGLMRPTLGDLLDKWPDDLTYSQLVRGRQVSVPPGGPYPPPPPPPPRPRPKSLEEVIKGVQFEDLTGTVAEGLISESLYIVHPQKLRLIITLNRPLEGEEELRIFVGQHRIQQITKRNVDQVEAILDLTDCQVRRLYWLQVGAFPTPRAWDSKPRDTYDFHFYLVPGDQKWVPFEGNLTLSRGQFTTESMVEIAIEPLGSWDGEVNLSVMGVSGIRRWPLYEGLKLGKGNPIKRTVEEVRREAQRVANEPVEVDQILIAASDEHGSIDFTVYFGPGKESRHCLLANSIPQAVLSWMAGNQYDSPRPANIDSDFEFVYRLQREDHIEIKIGPRAVGAVEGATADRFQIKVPWLFRECEKIFLSDPVHPFPFILAEVDEENKTFKHRPVGIEDQPNWAFSFDNWDAFDNFIGKRLELFALLQRQCEEAKVETLAGLLLRDLAVQIEDYAASYACLLDSIVERYKRDNRGNAIPAYNSLLFIDTVFVPSRKTTEPYSLLLMAPTHPLHLRFLLQVEQQVYEWQQAAQSDSQVFRLFPTDFAQINGANLPLFLCSLGTTQPQVFVSGPPPNFHWGMYLPFEDRLQDYFLTDSVLGRIVKSCLFPDYTESPTSSLAGAIRSRIRAFLEAHPFLNLPNATVQINFFNPGTGEDILAAIEDVASSGDNSPFFSVRLIDLKYQGQPEIPDPAIGMAFDVLFARVDVNDKQRKTRERLTYSVTALSIDKLQLDRFPPTYYAHLHFVADFFRSELVTSIFNSFPPSVIGDGLVSEFDLEFSLGDSRFYGGLWFPADCSAERYKLSAMELNKKIAEIVAAQSMRAYQPDRALYSSLSFDPASKERILPLHQHGIWVCFLDRDVGIQGFDFPQLGSGTDGRDIFLLDYTRKFEQELGGYDLITTTQKIDSVRGIIRNHLSQNRYGLSTQGEQIGAQKLLSRINALSGRWGMSLINLLPNEIGGICGDAIVFLYLEQIERRFLLRHDHGVQSLSIVLPTDEYMRVSGKDGRPLKDGWKWQSSTYRDGRCSDDLLELRLTAQGDGRYNIVGTVIEVKHGVAASSRIEEAREQVINAYHILTHRFAERQGARIDSLFRQAELARLVSFHGAKLARHKVYGTGDVEREAIEFILTAASAIQSGRFSISFRPTFDTDHTTGIEVNGIVALIDLSEGTQSVDKPSRSVTAGSMAEVVGVLRLPSGFVCTLLE